jgi:hypothetical protein
MTANLPYSSCVVIDYGPFLAGFLMSTYGLLESFYWVRGEQEGKSTQGFL